MSFTEQEQTDYIETNLEQVFLYIENNTLIILNHT